MRALLQQPEALRLADNLEFYDGKAVSYTEAADELRRLHAENEALRAELDQPATFKPLGTVYRWTALKDGKPVYQYGEDGYPQMFAKTALKLPDEPEPAQGPEKKHPFQLWGEYETRIEALAREVSFHKSLSEKATQSPPVTQEITRLKSIIEDMQLKLDAAPPAQPAQEPLTSFEIARCDKRECGVVWSWEDKLEFARAIEAAHGIGGKA